MRLFRRSKSTQSNVPLEVAEYYQAERKERHGVAWLMTLVTLLVTAAIVVGFFLAGRWAYRTLKHHDTPSATKTTSNEGKKSDSSESKTSSDSANSNSGSSTTPPASETPAQSTPADEGAGESAEHNSGTDTAPSESSPAPTTPAPAPSESALANTGPGDTATLLFVFTSALTYVAYRYKLARQN